MLWAAAKVCPLSCSVCFSQSASRHGVHQHDQDLTASDSTNACRTTLLRLREK